MKFGVKKLYWNGHEHMSGGYTIERDSKGRYVLKDNDQILIVDGNECSVLSIDYRKGVILENKYNGRKILLSFEEFEGCSIKRYEFL